MTHTHTHHQHQQQQHLPQACSTRTAQRERKEKDREENRAVRRKVGGEKGEGHLVKVVFHLTDLMFPA